MDLSNRKQALETVASGSQVHGDDHLNYFSCDLNCKTNIDGKALSMVLVLQESAVSVSLV